MATVVPLTTDANSDEDVPANRTSPFSQTMSERAMRAPRSAWIIGVLLALLFSVSVGLWGSGAGRLRCPDCNCGALHGPPASAEGAETALGRALAIFCASLALCIFASYFKLKRGISSVPDCIVYVLLGAVVGSVLRLAGNHKGEGVEFTLPNQEQFFIFILPPIMFEAGYSLNKSDFFAEGFGILMFAVPGTILCSIVFGAGIYLIGFIGASYAFTFWESMTFGALISAVDPVATIAVFSALRVNKTLHFLVFGESVLNDAVAIVLYRTFSQLIGSSTHWYSPPLEFVRVFFGSAILGALSATITALILKYSELYRNPQLEMSFIFVLAYFPYFLCDSMGMSGIMGTLANGATLAHYAHHNLSKVTQISAQQTFRTLSFLAEAFVFVFLGTALTTFDHMWSFRTIFWGVVLALVSRAANIYPLAAFVNQGREMPISKKSQFIMWFSGLRGAVSFALSLNFPAKGGSDDARRVVISSTLAIVLFTVVVLGGGILPLLKLLRVESEPESGPSGLRSSGAPGEAGSAQGESRLMRWLHHVDEEILSPFLLASSTRAMVATNRTLQNLAVTEGSRLTPLELGRVLDSSAAAQLASPPASAPPPTNPPKFDLEDADDSADEEALLTEDNP